MIDSEGNRAIFRTRRFQIFRADLAVWVDDGGEVAFAYIVRDDDQTVMSAFDDYRVAMKLPALTGC
jgi:hypothetical protein